MNLLGAKTFILSKLKRELDPRLTYHSVEHTLDVLDSAMRLGGMENLNEHQMGLLETAALFHDSGMLKKYKGHEQASVEIVDDLLPKFGYDKKEIEQVSQMIMATRIPQQANTKLEMIICDADLDYLGRNDFFMIAHQLKYEWDILGFRQTTLREWYNIQIDFLTSHTYFTPSARKMRQQLKLKNLAQIREILNHQI